LYIFIDDDDDETYALMTAGRTVWFCGKWQHSLHSRIRDCRTTRCWNS